MSVGLPLDAEFACLLHIHCPEAVRGHSSCAANGHTNCLIQGSYSPFLPRAERSCWALRRLKRVTMGAGDHERLGKSSVAVLIACSPGQRAGFRSPSVLLNGGQSA